MTIIDYLKARLLERTTWAGITAAIVGGAAVATPYSYMLIVAGVIGALTPSATRKGEI